MSGLEGAADGGVDLVQEWSRARERVSALVREASPEARSRHVPACPAWTCLDLLRHMVGLGADVLAGNEPDDHDPGWTQAQVEARAGDDADALLAEWDALAPDLVRWMAAHGSRPLNDVVIHEQDLRGALGEPGARATPGFTAVRERMATRLGSAVEELPGIALEAPDWRWSSGPDPEVVLRASGFDLARALTSRRTPSQLRSWVVRGDLAPYVDAFGGLGALPDEPLPE